MKVLSAITAANIILSFGSNADAQADSGEVGGCSDPLKATLDTLQCITDRNATCAGASYNTEFKKYHNGVDTNTVINGAAFWEEAFTLYSNISFTFDHLMNVGPNMASIRYIEFLKFTNGTTLGLPASSEFPWSYETMQHEHALVTVDDECKIKTWDQYGDNEQQINEGAIAAIMAELCAKQMAPPEMCVPPTSANETAAVEEDSGAAAAVTSADETKKGDGSSSANSWNLSFFGGLATAGLTVVLTFAMGVEQM